MNELLHNPDGVLPTDLPAGCRLLTVKENLALGNRSERLGAVDERITEVSVWEPYAIPPYWNSRDGTGVWGGHMLLTYCVPHDFDINKYCIVEDFQVD